MCKDAANNAKYSRIKPYLLILVAAVIGGLVNEGFDLYKTMQQAKIELIEPTDGQNISVPYDLVVQFRNRPKGKFLCAFMRGSGERLYYPLIPDSRITEEDGEWKYAIKKMGSQDDNSMPYELVLGFASDSSYGMIEDVYFGQKTNNFWSLPQGVEEEKRITIFRKGS